VLHRCAFTAAVETGGGEWVLRRSPGERLLFEYVAHAAGAVVEVLRALAAAAVLPRQATAAVLLAPSQWAPALKDAPKSPLLQVGCGAGNAHTRARRVARLPRGSVEGPASLNARITPDLLSCQRFQH
jgi:hypothetical protein